MTSGSLTDLKLQPFTEFRIGIGVKIYVASKFTFADSWPRRGRDFLVAAEDAAEQATTAFRAGVGVGVEFLGKVVGQTITLNAWSFERVWQRFNAASWQGLVVWDDFQAER